MVRFDPLPFANTASQDFCKTDKLDQAVLLSLYFSGFDFN
jgi:hypothetical protein